MICPACSSEEYCEYLKLIYLVSRKVVGSFIISRFQQQHVLRLLVVVAGVDIEKAFVMLPALITLTLID